MLYYLWDFLSDVSEVYLNSQMNNFDPVYFNHYSWSPYHTY